MKWDAWIRFVKNENFLLKVVAFCLAVLLWAYVYFVVPGRMGVISLGR